MESSQFPISDLIFAFVFGLACGAGLLYTICLCMAGKDDGRGSEEDECN